MKPVNWKRFQGICCLGLAAALAPGTCRAVINANDSQSVAPVTAPPPAVVVPAPSVSAPPPPPAPPAATPSKLSGPAREVVKLISSGVPEDVVRTYVENSPSVFSLSPDAVIELHQLGVSNEIATAMLTHDKILRENSFNVNASVTQPMVPPQAPATTYPYPQTGDASAALPSDYYNELAPYGSWTYQPAYNDWSWQPYAGVDYSVYPWWLWGCGGWSFLPNSGWCWFPHGRFNAGFGRFGGYVRNGYYNRGFGGYGGYNHFYGGRSYAGFNHSLGFNHSFNGGGHSFAMNGGHSSFSGGGHSFGGHASGGGHSGGGGRR